MRIETAKRKNGPLTRERQSSKRANSVITVAVNGSKGAEEEKLNSEVYPGNERPPMYQDDGKFNQLSKDRAAKICFQYYMMTEKKKEKEMKQNAIEKCYDEIPTVMIKEGEDNAGEKLNIEARKALRPVNKEINSLMDWFPSSRKEIVRNLPLGVYGLQDSVSTKAIELCHNLASTIEIKMFSPTNLRTSATSQRQKAFTDKEGKLVVESDDIYGELETTSDVLLAWNTLDCIWQKIHPEWPVAKIGLRVCIAMKLFRHCENKAKDIMVTFSNRFLAGNSSRVANKQGPMSYE